MIKEYDSMTSRTTITLDNDAYSFLMAKGGKNKSAYINQLLKKERQRTFLWGGYLVCMRLAPPQLLSTVSYFFINFKHAPLQALPSPKQSSNPVSEGLFLFLKSSIIVPFWLLKTVWSLEQEHTGFKLFLFFGDYWFFFGAFF